MPFLIVLFSGIGLLIYLRRMRYARSRREAKRYRRDYIGIGVLLLLIGVFYYFRQRNLATLIAPVHITALAEVEALEERTALLAEGQIDPAAATLLRDYVAYTREDTTGATEQISPAFTLILSDGAILVQNDNYNAWNWARAASPSEDYFYLRAGDPVVVNADLTRRSCLAADAEAGETPLLCASVVYAGSYADYASEVRRSIAWNRAGMIAGLLAGLLSMSFVEWFLLIHRRRLDGGPASKEEA